MILLSPQMFLFFTIYTFFIFLMSCVDSYFIFWSVMEFSTLVFMGFAYSAMKNSFSNLLIFFIIQAYSAMMLLIFFCISSCVGFTFSIFLKLSMFPFYFWYVSIVPFFSNFMFLFSSTFFKIPSIFMVYNFFYMMDTKFLYFSMILTICVGSFSMINSSDVRFIMISSSVVNNSWFILSQMVSLFVFFIYFFIYFMSLLFIVFLIRSNSSSNMLSYVYTKEKMVILFLFATLAGLPPFPMFYIKMFTILNIMFSMQSVIFIMLVLLVSVLTLIGYLKYIFNSLMFNYTNLVCFLFFYN